MTENIKQEYMNGRPVVDLTQEGSPFVEGLKKPLRIMLRRIGPVWYRIARGADDPTPDYIFRQGPVWVNAKTGILGRNKEDVM